MQSVHRETLLEVESIINNACGKRLTPGHRRAGSPYIIAAALNETI